MESVQDINHSGSEHLTIKPSNNMNTPSDVSMTQSDDKTESSNSTYDQTVLTSESLKASNGASEIANTDTDDHAKPDKSESANKDTEEQDEANVGVDAKSIGACGEPDEYEYTKRDSFTSEIYKLSVKNLPRICGFKEFRKKLSQLDVKPVKTKIMKDIAFVTFRNEEEKAAAQAKLDGLKYKGQILKAEHARPAADPLMLKRKQQEKQDGRQDGHHEEKKRKIEDDGLTPTERLLNSVTPLWKLPYEEQLKKKQEEMAEFFKKYHRQLQKNCADLQRWLHEMKQKHGYKPCELQQIKASPMTEGYRNKCEFTIGPGLDGQDNVVGFRFGQYSQGTICVGSPDQVYFLSDAMRTVVQAFQKYLSTCELKAFNPEDHSGHYRQLSVRTSQLGHVMILVCFHSQELEQEKVDSEISKLREYFVTGEGKDAGVTSCYFRTDKGKITGTNSDTPYKLVFGEEHITEILLGLKFRISPDAFFQVNTPAAELLYSQVAEWCNNSPSTTVLDICCGTGTIGLTVAKSVEKVIGIEMCSQAVQDAKVNAEINGISNVTYYCSKAEEVMLRVAKSVTASSDVVAVVDPPRGGLHSSVVVTIRNCRNINRLVYVSCSVNGALNNLIDLVRPTSKRLKGRRFLPVKAVPIDLFPHTNHCELVILFEREKDEPSDDST